MLETLNCCKGTCPWLMLLPLRLFRLMLLPLYCFKADVFAFFVVGWCYCLVADVIATCSGVWLMLLPKKAKTSALKQYTGNNISLKSLNGNNINHGQVPLQQLSVSNIGYNICQTKLTSKVTTTSVTK